MLKRLIQRFSPVALTGASLMLVTGLIAALSHIKAWTQLWGTSYGVTLSLKVAIVLAVAALGAWNWRRVAPLIDSAQSAETIRRSSTLELLLGAVVLFITAILVLLPNPR
jgi:copper transport protein